MDPLRAALDIADSAFHAWRRIEGDRGLDEMVGIGADGTPTILADQVLEEAAIARAADHGVSVLSEEAGFVQHGDGPDGRIAVLDPLDGSRNAGRGIPFHCTSVAIGRRDMQGLEAGVVRNLVTGDTFAAAPGRGARCNGEPVVRRDFDEAEVMVAVIADSSADDVVQEQERRGHHLRDLGAAALELCLVGTGALDAFVVREPWLRVYDIAAGALFVEEAGGLVRDPHRRGDDGRLAPLATPFTLEARSGIVAGHSRSALEAVL